MIDEMYMNLAIKEAQKAADMGEIPIGAILVMHNKVIAQAHNMREQWRDATAHAEIIVIQDACKKLNRWRLEEATLYVTLEPCPMCAGAIVNSRINKVVYGCADSKGGGVESIFNILSNKNLNHVAEVVRGVCEEECAQILKEFFKKRRKENKLLKKEKI